MNIFRDSFKFFNFGFLKQSRYAGVFRIKSFTFVDILRLYKGEYVIDGIVLRGGQLYVADFISGNNYDIIKPSTDTSTTALSFEIKSLKLNDCKIRYEHTPSRFKMNGFTPYSQITLKYKDEKLLISKK